jgi:hypothetical protein
MDNPKVFCDFHHASLLYSFILLFEKRLGGSVYRPIGTEWADYGFWKVYDHPATIQQFLTLAQGYQPVDGTKPLNNIVKKEKDVYYCQDIDSGYYNKAITFETFCKMDIDIVIASIPHHIEPFRRLIREYKPNAKLIYQVGNSWTIEAGLAPNIMASAIIGDVPPEINFISYHQEFDLDVFKPNAEVIPSKNIYSFVNCFNIMEPYKYDWQLFTDMEAQMPDWAFRCFGGQCRDGAAHGSKELAETMQKSKFIWHTKVGGDGYGHIIFNSAAVGRPLIIKKSYYRGKMAEKLLLDGVTCIDIDGLSTADIKQKIEHFSEEKEYKTMCFNVYDNFKHCVNFDIEEIRLREFLSKLV